MIKSQVISYLKSIALLAAIFLVLGTMLLKHFGYASVSYHLYFLIALFTVVSGVFHFLLMRTLQKKPKRFVPVFLISSVAKILLYLSALIAYIFTMVVGIKIFLLCFLILYLSFTIFEVFQLVNYVKNKSSEGVKE